LTIDVVSDSVVLGAGSWIDTPDSALLLLDDSGELNGEASVRDFRDKPDILMNKKCFQTLFVDIFIT
jgi:hypothetical protein